MIITQILASLGSEAGMKPFQKRYEQLETIISVCKRDEEVVITPEVDEVVIKTCPKRSKVVTKKPYHFPD